VQKRSNNQLFVRFVPFLLAAAGAFFLAATFEGPFAAVEARSGAMKVAELCELLGVDDKHIYRMAARGSLPSFHVGGAIRFDPQEVAKWLRARYGMV
jgi:excisionase family DNA binding protein